MVEETVAVGYSYLTLILNSLVGKAGLIRQNAELAGSYTPDQIGTLDKIRRAYDEIRNQIDTSRLNWQDEDRLDAIDEWAADVFAQ